MDTIGQGIQKGFRWLASLNPQNLCAAVSIGKEYGSFADDNWETIEAFASGCIPHRDAVIVLQRTEADGAQIMMGMCCRDGKWTQIPSNMLSSTNKISPQLQLREATLNLRLADIKSIFPNCPAAGLPENEETQLDEVHESSMTGAKVVQCPITISQINKRAEITHDIVRMFEWISTLDPVKDNLYCAVTTGSAENSFWEKNWDALPQWTDMGSPTTATILLEKETKLENGEKKATIMGLKHWGRKWEILTREEIKALPLDDPETFDWVAKKTNAEYINIKKLYPSCPI